MLHAGERRAECKMPAWFGPGCPRGKRDLRDARIGLKAGLARQALEIQEFCAPPAETHVFSGRSRFSIGNARKVPQNRPLSVAHRQICQSSPAPD